MQPVRSEGGTVPVMHTRPETRNYDEPGATHRFSGATAVVALIVVLFTVTVILAIIVDNKASSSEPVTAPASGFSSAGPGSVVGHFNGDGSMSAPTGASFIYLIGGWTP